TTTTTTTTPMPPKNRDGSGDDRVFPQALVGVASDTRIPAADGPERGTQTPLPIPKTARRASLRLGLCPAAARALVGRAAFGDLNLALPQAVAVGKLRLAYVRLRALAEEDVPILPRAARPIDLVLLAKRLRYLSMSGVDSMRRMNK
ncbi:unnamed protein product, partial [Prorocentrum cordatum]